MQVIRYKYTTAKVDVVSSARCSGMSRGWWSVFMCRVSRVGSSVVGVVRSVTSLSIRGDTEHRGDGVQRHRSVLPHAC